jgi:hypothetical protein
MRCAKARELYFGSYDGIIDEAKRMKLQAHLDRCAGCASFVEEMEGCLGMLKDLPELSPSENFSWNLKRRILQEKSRLLRRAGSSYFPDIHWGMKFVASAAAVIVVALVGAWFLLGDHAISPAYTDFAGAPTTVDGLRETSIPRIDPGSIVSSDRSAGMRLVSDQGGGAAMRPGAVGSRAFQDAALSREDSLCNENEYLKSRIRRIERENLILKRNLYYYRVRTKR